MKLMAKINQGWQSYLAFIRQWGLDRPCRCVPLVQSMAEMEAQEGRTPANKEDKT